jgi:inner membrane transporter RhtA
MSPLSILPASASLTGPLVLAQRPGVRDLLGVALAVAAVAVHQEPAS